jgi:hypothetical protein
MPGWKARLSIYEQHVFHHAVTLADTADDHDRAKQ